MTDPASSRMVARTQRALVGANPFPALRRARGPSSDVVGQLGDRGWVDATERFGSWKPFVVRVEPLDHPVFQGVFGEILNLLIAMEFNHTVLYKARRQESVVQAGVVIWIALLALARTFIVLDVATTVAEQMFGLAAITVALGLVLWLAGREVAPPGPETPDRSHA